MEPVSPKDVRFIKLGRAGQWADLSIDRGEIHCGYRAAPHDLCLAGDWEGVSRMMTERGSTPEKARAAIRELKDFYGLGPDCLWITIEAGHLFWAFAAPEVFWLGGEGEEHGLRMRRTLGGWRKESITGELLASDRLSSRLTQVAGFRQTICRIKEADYLLRKINGLEEPVVAEAKELKSAMKAVAGRMIAGLHQNDFESLVDLIFSRGGWQRVSRLGGTQADVDLVVEQPATGEKAFVQVKSRATQAVLDDYLERFRQHPDYDRFFFVCHSPGGRLVTPAGDHFHIWAGDRLADLALRAGLFDWLMERAA